MPKRCALGCPLSSGMIRHHFPNPDKFPEQFKKWVTVAGGKLETSTDYEDYRKKVVCDIHFTNDVRNRNKRLNALAVPTLNLPGQPVLNIENNLETVPQPIHDVSIVISDINESHAGSSAKEQDATETVNSDVNKSQNPGSSAKEKDSIETETDVSFPDGQPHLLANIIKEHNYCKTQGNKSSKNNVIKKLPALLVNTIKPIQRQVINLRRQVNRLQRNKDSFKSRLANAEKISQESAFKKVTESMTNPAKIFTAMQSRLTKTKAKGRRFTLEEKVLTLSLYKRSPKGFTLLSKYFTLPSPKSLKRLLAQIKLQPGINKLVFEKIKTTVQKLKVEERLCTLIFDEMSLTPQIHFDAVKDKLKGFTSHGAKGFANHALVFMVKGIKTNYKQPVAYYFTSSLNGANLKFIIKEVITNVQATGLKVICTVCNQGASNVAAISALVAETKKKHIEAGKQWKSDHFKLNNQKVIPLFDVPHLLKGLRNNLLSKDMSYIDYNDHNKEKIVKWEYFVMLYETDKSAGELRCLQKLTDEHIYREKIKKMRVKNAAQVFSHNVACTTDHLTARKLLPEECQQLVPIVTLIDNVFDSLHSNTFHIPNGKMYKGPVRKFSPHHHLWENAIKTLKSVKFISAKKTADKIRLIETIPPSVKNLIKTIEGMKLIWEKLSSTYKFDCMLTRNFNQDPVEIFFGNIRSYGARNIAPNCIAFEGAYKSLLLNNYNSTHSIGANCEIDNNDCLQSLDFFLDSNNLNENDVTAASGTYECTEYNIDVLVYDYDNVIQDHGQKNYVCGWVLTKCLKKIGSCKTCKQILIGDKNDSSNDYIMRREYKKDKSWLCYPSSALMNSFSEIQNIVVNCLKKSNVPKENLKHTLKMYIDIYINFPHQCNVHVQMAKDFFITTTMNILIYSWCRSINRILSGKIKYDGDDYSKNEAVIYYNKHKHYKNK